MKNTFLSISYIILAVSFLPAHAETNASSEVVVATVDFPPFGVRKENSAAGVGVDIVREIGRQRKLTLREIFIPIARIDEIAEKMPSVFPIMTRSEKREKQLEWIGKLGDDSYCFLTLKSAPAVNSLDEARKLKAIGVNKGGSSEAAIIKQGGFNNLNGSSGSSANVRKLFAKRVNATWATQMTYAFAVKVDGHDPKDVVCTGEYAKHEYWVAASKKLPAETLEQYKSSFAELEKQGFLKKALASY